MNTWPKWLPYPISWIRAFGLTYALTVQVKSQFPLQYGKSVVGVLVGVWLFVPFLFAFFHWAITSATKLLLIYLPAHPKLALVRQYLTERSGLERSHWREGLNALIVSFVAFAVTIFVLSQVLQIPSRADVADDFESMILRQDILQFAREMIPIGMFLVSAYIYQYDLWARHRRAAKLAAKAKAQEPTQKRSPTRKVPAPNRVDRDLDKLRGESGMSRMKTAKPAQPNPEIPEWYVFRSGSAEGPYTKIQLLDVQKISDRTKVRRGEAEWQRAGEIPELAAYLTEK